MTTLMRKPQGSSANSLGYLLIIAVFILVGLVYFLPGLRQTSINPSDDIIIYYMGEAVGQAQVNEGELYLPFAFIKEYVDPNLAWDEESKTVIITTPKEVFHLPLGKREGMLNLEPYSFSYPVISKDGEIFLPALPLDKYYNWQLNHLSEQSVVIIHDLKEPLLEGRTLENITLRQSPSPMAPWVAKGVKGSKVNIFREDNGWYWVETEDGSMGYLNKKAVEITGIETVEVTSSPYQPWNPLGEKIMLTWEGAWGATVNPETLGNLQGVQVLSPTWFSLGEDGMVKNTSDYSYVQWAHQTGRQVWALFDNSFDKDLTHEFLTSGELRQKAIKQLLTYVDLYQLDGINLDFENMHLKDKDNFVQFVRELAPLLHEKDRSISVNVTFISKSENWSMCYDRKSLGEIVDYVTVMAYDENGSFSTKAGSVSSLPWVEEGIKKILQEIPNEKIILGVPFYTRLWEEGFDEKGERTLTSKAISMSKQDEWIAKNQVEIKMDSATGQNYGEIQQDGKTFKIWLEDEYSMTQRIALMKKYHLAGIAAWRRGYEKDGFWPILDKILNQY